MKTLLIVVGLVVATGLFTTLAFPNPSMIPKHPGYPAKEALDPVTGQSLANDPGETNAGGRDALSASARFDDARSVQDFDGNRDNARVLDNPGAGLLPTVEGPQIQIEPPVNEATRMRR